MQRHEDWPHKLRCYLEAQGLSEFKWGTNDCCSNVCDWIRLCTDVDVYAEFRGKYTTEAEAGALIQQVTGTGSEVEDAAAYITAKFHMTEISPMLAQRGDVVQFNGTNGQMLGIVHLHPARAVFLTERGFLQLPTAKCRRAWRV